MKKVLNYPLSRNFLMKNLYHSSPEAQSFLYVKNLYLLFITSAFVLIILMICFALLFHSHIQELNTYVYTVQANNTIYNLQVLLWIFLFSYFISLLIIFTFAIRILPSYQHTKEKVFKESSATTHEHLTHTLASDTSPSWDSSSAAHAILSSHDDERQEVSLYLHENLAQMLVASKYQLQSLDVSQPVEAEKRIQKIDSHLTNILSEVKLVSFKLKPLELEDLGLIVALNKLTLSLSTTSKVSIQFTEQLSTKRLDHSKEVSIYRIILGCLEHIIRMRMTEKISFNLEEKQRNIFVSFYIDLNLYEEKLKGEYLESYFSNSKEILSVRERVQILKGTFTYKLINNKNLQIIIQILNK